MKTIYILTLQLLLTYNLNAFEYIHPGQGSFLELGAIKTWAPYGYELYAPYAAPKFSYGRATLQGFRLNYDVFQSELFKIGPMLQYNFSPYAGTETKTLEGMKRNGFVNFGALASISIPFGEIFLSFEKTKHDEPNGQIAKMGYGTGIPLFRTGAGHIWFNIMLEYSLISSNTATYLFGVKESEERANRPATELPNISLFTSILGIWTPIGNNFWINLTYKVDNYDKVILKSPIVKKDKDTAVMLALMYDFVVLD